MKFWENPIIKSLGWKEEPKGVAKVMSVCMLIVIFAAYFLPTSIQEIKLVSTIMLGSTIIFFVLLAYVMIKRFL